VTALVDFIRSTPAWLLDHPVVAAGAFVALLAVFTIGGLALHLGGADRRQERRDRRRYGR